MTDEHERTRTDGSEHDTSAHRGECRECETELGAGYLCDQCDTVEGWPA